ncbi:hypothetical protein [Aurantiacibacter sp. D1-12]|uniref:hypothetical protein n=1 Tax=Aurantiacibacter sp. D1-12 TaxID=2993658 RepID=UPI00237C9E24|nr:hypothetical protein [Aurantiacibacter sp. D1-12]MDE1467433.1 hypothetical protein [Aurantiacibacter sp. D1-12]
MDGARRLRYAEGMHRLFATPAIAAPRARMTPTETDIQLWPCDSKVEMVRVESD